MAATLDLDARAYARWSDVPSFWRGANGPVRPSPFQTDGVLSAWYATIGVAAGVVPLIVELTLAGGAPLMLMPLIVERRAGLRLARFADRGVIDNAAPLLAPGADARALDAKGIADAIRRAAPDVDALILEKQPPVLAGHPNPLAGGSLATPSALSAHPISFGEAFAPYRAARTKHFRKEQERIGRVFDRHPGARFELVDDAAGARAVFDFMEAFQTTRLDALGIAHDLALPEVSAFYRRVIETGAPRGETAFGVLRDNEEIVAAVLALIAGERATFVRLAHRGGDWAKCSPGRLVVDRTLEALHARGIRVIDLSIGDYHYKEGFGGATVPLRETRLGFGWRGRAYVAAISARRTLAANPALRGFRDRLRGGAARPPVLAKG
jgi:CelD/BcsL family acetyltransferase involved in cellulose biosynthesis